LTILLINVGTKTAFRAHVCVSRSQPEYKTRHKYSVPVADACGLASL